MDETIVTLSMPVLKASMQKTGRLRWKSQISTDEIDGLNERLDTSLYDELCQNFHAWREQNTSVPVVAFLKSKSWTGPILEPAHFSLDVDPADRDKVRIGSIENLYRDGRTLHAWGWFDETPVGKAAFDRVRLESSDITTSICFVPDMANLAFEGATKVYRGGTGKAYMDHVALTTVPVNGSTDFEVVTKSQSKRVTKDDDLLAVLGQEIGTQIISLSKSRRGTIKSQAVAKSIGDVSMTTPIQGAQPVQPVAPVPDTQVPTPAAQLVTANGQPIEQLVNQQGQVQIAPQQVQPAPQQAQAALMQDFLAAVGSPPAQNQPQALTGMPQLQNPFQVPTQAAGVFNQPALQQPLWGGPLPIGQFPLVQQPIAPNAFGGTQIPLSQAAQPQQPEPVYQFTQSQIQAIVARSQAAVQEAYQAGTEYVLRSLTSFQNMQNMIQRSQNGGRQSYAQGQIPPSQIVQVQQQPLAQQGPPVVKSQSEMELELLQQVDQKRAAMQGQLMPNTPMPYLG